MRCGPPGVGRVGSAPQGADCVRLPGPWTGSPVSSTQGRRRSSEAQWPTLATRQSLDTCTPWCPGHHSARRNQIILFSAHATCSPVPVPLTLHWLLGARPQRSPDLHPQASRGSVLCPLCCGGASSAGWEWGLLHLTVRALSPCSFLPQCRRLVFTEPSFTPPLFTIQPCVVQCGSH